ncbi:hypothetical protein C8R43DRAFT_1160607 [Mycena crocata]|nr:hypothetical protein C8R43DRAFT_1160607 [Mycena crocata]
MAKGLGRGYPPSQVCSPPQFKSCLRALAQYCHEHSLFVEHYHPGRRGMPAETTVAQGSREDPTIRTRTQWSVSLYIQLSGGHDSSTVNLIADQSHRWKTIKFRSFLSSGEIWSQVKKKLPILEVLEIRNPYEDMKMWDLSKLPPSLRSSTAPASVLVRTVLPAIHTIGFLHVDPTNAAMVATSMSRMVGNCGLEFGDGTSASFDLDASAGSDLHIPPATSRIGTLSVQVDECPFSDVCVEQILSCLTLPHLRALV